MICRSLDAAGCFFPVVFQVSCAWWCFLSSSWCLLSVGLSGEAVQAPKARAEVRSRPTTATAAARATSQPNSRCAQVRLAHRGGSSPRARPRFLELCLRRQLHRHHWRRCALRRSREPLPAAPLHPCRPDRRDALCQPNSRLRPSVLRRHLRHPPGRR